MSLLVEPRKKAGDPLTLQDLAERFGPMLPSRIRFEPAPGTATEADLLRSLESESRLCELVWFVDHRKRICEVYTPSEQCTVLTADQTLTGGTVLPGFELNLRELFSRLDDQ